MTLQTRDAQPVIPADRFTLRPLRRSDVGLIGLYSADSRVACATRTIPHPLPPGAAEAFVTRVTAPTRTEDVWAFDGSEAGQGELLGLITLSRLDRGQSEVSYWVAPAFWNTGLATEGLRALIEANPQGARQLFAAVFQDNPVSARVLTNCGFEYLGDAEAYSVARGATVPTWTYALKLTN